MLQLHNNSPFAAGIYALPDPHGVDTLVVVIKASFELSTPLRVAAEQREIVLGDEHVGAPGESGLRHPGEAHPAKPGTDVLIVGDACAPGDRLVHELELVAQVAGRDKRARVYGDRLWTQGAAGIVPSRPAPFVRMPLVWERAYGGRERPTREAEVYESEPRNPVGLGFIARGQGRDFVGLPVPNFDDPRAPLTKLGQAPTPVGFGPVAPAWQPRLGHAGTYDPRWHKTRAPHLPHDFDPQFFHCATPELAFARPLIGGEPIALLGFDPRGLVHISLPRCRFNLEVRIAGRAERPEPVLDLVVLAPSESWMTMSWRAVVTVDKKLLQVERVDVELAAIEGAVQA